MNQVQLTPEVKKVLDESDKGIPVSDIGKIKSIPKEYVGYLITEKGVAFQVRSCGYRMISLLFGR